MEDRPFVIDAVTDPSTCKYCKSTVYWVKTKNGKNITVNPDGMFHMSRCSDAPPRSETKSSGTDNALYNKIKALETRVEKLEAAAGVAAPASAADPVFSDVVEHPEPEQEELLGPDPDQELPF